MQMDNHWWPAILSCQIEDPWVWVRCDALINQFARPWQTHINRVRVFDKVGNAIPMIMHSQIPWSPQPPPPATPPPLPTWMTNSTVEIVELEEVTDGPTVSPVTAAGPVQPAAPVTLMLPDWCSRKGCWEVAKAEWCGYCSWACWTRHAFVLEVVSSTSSFKQAAC